MDFGKVLSEEFKIREDYSRNIIMLIEEGNTIPFIARYRKEMHGTCDDQVLREFADRLKYLQNLQKRKDEVTSSIEQQGKLTDEIVEALDKARTMTEVEDIYRPYKQKRKTRASVAVEKGLKPLADVIYAQELKSGDVLALAKDYVDEEKGVNSPEDALAGAKDIIAELISDDAALRKTLRSILVDKAVVSTKLLEAENSKTYDMYADYSEPVKTIPSHRILAINRGEKEKCLKVSVDIDDDVCLAAIYSAHIKGDSIFKSVMEDVAADSFKRLIFPSVSNEVRNDLTDKADEQAIKMFEVNLKPLLMQPPLKGKTILAVDPAYRTGCKIAVIDKNGNVLDTGVVYPTPPQSKIEESERILTRMIQKHSVDVISIGNGTASKEAEIFVSNLIKVCGRPVSYAVVNEAGASVYSASKLGAEEFPEFDVSLRSAVSIARRLQDPLAELIKIDVKSIGVGQYQHDMPQNRLTEVLEGVVEDCVNSVGVDLNTASVSLLSYVSGLNSGVAKKIVEYRQENAFTERKQLLKVPKLGAKAYEQCAGFLRIPGGKNVLDNTSVHPESYDAALKLLDLCGFTLEDVKAGRLGDLKNKVEREGIEKVAFVVGVGVPTLEDIITEIVKPGRDVRDSLPTPVLRSDLLDIKDLKPGMELDGVVRNVIDFGVFVDIGVHQDGLVHISQIADGYISHPSEVLSVGQSVTVKVLDVDLVKKKISLTLKTSKNPYGMKKKEDVARQERRSQPNRQNDKNRQNRPDNRKKEEQKTYTLQDLLNKYNKH